MISLHLRGSVGILRRASRRPWYLLYLVPLLLILGAQWESRAWAGAPATNPETRSLKAILIGQTPPSAQTYIGQASLLLVDANDWKPLRLPGSVPKLVPLMTGTLMYEADARYEHSAKILSFVAAQPMDADAIRQRAGKSPQGAVLLAHTLSSKEGLAALEAVRRELGEEGYAVGLRLFEHRAELVACAKKSASCLYELVALEIEAGRFSDAAELLSTQRTQFDAIASSLHDKLEYHCAPVHAGRGGANPATGLSWAALLRIALLEQGGLQQKADAERRELLRRAPRYSESVSEGYYEGFAPLDHVLFRHDRPRVLYQRATEKRPANP